LGGGHDGIGPTYAANGPPTEPQVSDEDGDGDEAAKVKGRVEHFNSDGDIRVRDSWRKARCRFEVDDGEDGEDGGEDEEAKGRRRGRSTAHHEPMDNYANSNRQQLKEMPSIVAQSPRTFEASSSPHAVETWESPTCSTHLRLYSPYELSPILVKAKTTCNPRRIAIASRDMAKRGGFFFSNEEEMNRTDEANRTETTNRRWGDDVQ
jgi:hypothetical protein